MPVRHVLVVDDSKSARLMLRKMLQGFGLTVDTVESGEEALNYLRSQRPDAIFMDHTMPGMDGLTAVRRIHTDPDTAAIPVAMYTSKDDPAYRSEAYAAGAMDVLTKPAAPDVLGAVLERMNALINAPPPVETLETASKLWKRLTDRRRSAGRRLPPGSRSSPSIRPKWCSTRLSNRRCCR